MGQRESLDAMKGCLDACRAGEVLILCFIVKRHYVGYIPQCRGTLASTWWPWHASSMGVFSSSVRAVGLIWWHSDHNPKVNIHKENKNENKYII